MATELCVLLLPVVLIPGSIIHLTLPGTWVGLLRERARHDFGFGVCLNTGPVAGVPVAAKIGTEALVEDFVVGANGHIRLKLVGGRRFQVQELQPGETTVVAPRAVVHWRESRHDEDIDCARGLLRTLVEARGGQEALAQARFDDPDWISWQFAALDKQMSPTQLQELLEEDVPFRRVIRVLDAFAERPTPC
jgi:Lon protease-like protein